MTPIASNFFIVPPQKDPAGISQFRSSPDSITQLWYRLKHQYRRLFLAVCGSRGIITIQFRRPERSSRARPSRNLPRDFVAVRTFLLINKNRADILDFCLRSEEHT